jgi:hypothetical protein
MAGYETELHQRVDEILHYFWDPIGIAGEPNARDEYYAYIPNVLSLLSSNASAENIASYLDEVATKHMGLSANPKRSMLTAERLLDWKIKLLKGRPDILG